jgi:photosystem II stability/assembly factor-like uncharacterized protein
MRAESLASRQPAAYRSYDPRLDPISAKVFAQAIAIFLLALASQVLPAQAAWSVVGPAGGDARAFAAVPGHPNHLYLGTTNSWVYESLDQGARWRRLSKLDTSDGLILDNIVVDAVNPATVYVAAWKADHPDGGLWVSHDGGLSWSAVKGLRGQSIRAFVQAPSAPSTLYAGTLEGVFRSIDGGVSWILISPPGSSEIHEVESLAVDPMDPNIVYAGTWHLPWKTDDGGNNWKNIKKGLIDDSDVFSIIIDPANPHIVFLSACSGIYKSESGGELFRKIQGIPTTARRTRVLMQDPVNREIVYAGTTEGLYKTVDGGKHFQRMTGPDVIVNDVFVDPGDTNQVLLATDRGGVLASKDGGTSFAPSNEGFSGRKVEALLVDRGNPARLFVGVVNDKSYGGVFVSTNGGASWEQIGEGSDGGLDGRDIFALAQAADGTVLAGTSHGIFALDEGSARGNHPDEKSPSPETPINPPNDQIPFSVSPASPPDVKDPLPVTPASTPDVQEPSPVTPANPPEVKEPSPVAPANAANDEVGAGNQAQGTGRPLGVVGHDGAPPVSTNNLPNDKGPLPATPANPPNDKGPLPMTPANPPNEGVAPGTLSPPQPSETQKPVATWRPRNIIANTMVKPDTKIIAGKHINVEKQVKAPVIELASRVNALDVSQDVWLAATAIGLLTSKDQGATWQGGPVMGAGDYLSVAVHGETMAAARADGVVLSTDSGQTWMPMQIPTMLTRIHRIAFSADGTLWLGAREGIYFTRDQGKTWLWIERLPFRDVDDLTYDPGMGKVLASSRSSDLVYAIDPKTLSWKWWQTGYRIALVCAAGERLLAASLYDGVLVQPQAQGAETGQR